MHTLDVRAAARALEGDISGRDGVVCPGPSALENATVFVMESFAV